MPLSEQIQVDLVAAMKAREEAKLSTLRMIKAAMQRYAVDTGKPLDDPAVQQILKGLAKQRVDAAEAFRNGGREEQAQKEDAERAQIENYLPAAASEADIDAAITEAIAETGATSAKQMGAVIKTAQARLAGKTVDGRALSEKVKARLA